MLGFSIMQTKNFKTSRLGLEKEEVPEKKLTTFAPLQRKQRHSKIIPNSVTSTALNPLTAWIITKYKKS